MEILSSFWVVIGMLFGFSEWRSRPMRAKTPIPLGRIAFSRSEVAAVQGESSALEEWYDFAQIVF